MLTLTLRGTTKLLRPVIPVLQVIIQAVPVITFTSRHRALKTKSSRVYRALLVRLPEAPVSTSGNLLSLRLRICFGGNLIEFSKQVYSLDFSKGEGN